MNAGSLHAYTLALRDQYPSAADLRIRKANKPYGTVWQLIGRHPRLGKVARKLEASKESEVLTAAIQAVNELDLGIKRGTVLTGSNRGVAESAIDRVRKQGLRLSTSDARINRIKEVVRFLEDRQLRVSETTLTIATTELAPENNRRRRAICTAVRDIAITSKIELDLTGLLYQAPAAKRLEVITDEVLFRRLDNWLPKIENPGAIWVLRVVAVTGIRGNGTLSLDRDAWDLFEGGCAFNMKMTDRIRYWDSKRSRPAFASQTVRNWWEHWKLWDIPASLKAYWMPVDAAPSDEQLLRANKLLNSYSTALRHKVHPEASRVLGFRSLRHAATSRLLRAGVSLLDTAEITSSSTTEIERRYSDFFRDTSANRAADLL